MELTGRSIIGFRSGSAQGKSSFGFNPATGERLLPAYTAASAEEVDEAAQLAHRAWAEFRRSAGRERAIFLRQKLRPM